MRKEFKEKLEELVNLSGLKKKDIAKDIGVKPCTFAKYLSGEREPDFKTLCNLATALNTTSDYLLGRTKSSEDPTAECYEVLTRNGEKLSKEDKVRLASMLMKHLDN